MWQKLRKRLLQFIIFIIIMGAAFVALALYANYESSQSFVISQGNDDNEYVFDFAETKKWEENKAGYFYGIQYDGYVENKTSTPLKDWTIEISLPQGCNIDSLWNGEYVIEDDVLKITCVDYNDTIEPNEVQTFGFVLQSKFEDNFKYCIFRYHIDIKIYDVPLFFPVLLLLVIGVVAFIVDVVTVVRMDKLLKKQAEQKSIINQSFITFANMIDAKDSYTKGHSQRVALYSREIARRMGMDEDEQERVFYIALLHDIGKIGVTDAILKKNAKLTYDEFNQVKEHTSMGGDILKGFNAIEGIEDGARYHHERFDGKGYMEGLKGKNIPVVARIIGVADAFDAMSSARCYRNALDSDNVIDELLQNSGTQFDPDIVPFMMEMIEEGFAPIRSDDLSLEKELMGTNER